MAAKIPASNSLLPLCLLVFLLSTAATTAATGRVLTADIPSAAAPVDASLVSTAAGTGGGSSDIVTVSGGHPPLTFFMHDILGGTNPTARIVAGIVDDIAVSSQIPFARPNGAVLPLNSGINVGNGNRGAVDNNNIPFLTGLGGTTAITSNNGNGGNSLPLFAGGNLPEGTSLQRLLFGTMTVVDDELTEAPELGSPAVGRVQGFYVASSEEGVSQTLAITAMFKSGNYADTISFFGVHKTGDSESHLAVIGGTGKFVGASGITTIAIVNPAATVHESDGLETVLKFSVYLTY